MRVTAAAPPASCASMRRRHMPRTSARRSSSRSSSSDVVVGRVDDHLVPALDGRELVGHHAHGPAGTVRCAARGTVRVHLRRRERLVAGAEGAGRRAGGAPGRVGRPGGPRRSDDGELAVGRVAAQLAAGRRHRRSPLPATAKSSRPLCLAAYMAASARASASLLVLVVRGHERSAGRDRHAQAGVLRRREARVVDEPHEAAAVDGEVLLGGEAADDDELVASVAGGDVHLPHVVGEHAGDEPDGLVAGQVAEPVVDGLDLVDVDLDDAVLAAQPLEHRELLGQRGVQVPAVEQAGQRVGDGRVRELLDLARRAPCRPRSRARRRSPRRSARRRSRTAPS